MELWNDIKFLAYYGNIVLLYIGFRDSCKYNIICKPEVSKTFQS